MVFEESFDRKSSRRVVDALVDEVLEGYKDKKTRRKRLMSFKSDLNIKFSEGFSSAYRHAKSGHHITGMHNSWEEIFFFLNKSLDILNGLGKKRKKGMMPDDGRIEEAYLLGKSLGFFIGALRWQFVENLSLQMLTYGIKEGGVIDVSGGRIVGRNPYEKINYKRYLNRIMRLSADIQSRLRYVLKKRVKKGFISRRIEGLKKIVKVRLRGIWAKKYRRYCLETLDFVCQCFED